MVWLKLESLISCLVKAGIISCWFHNFMVWLKLESLVSDLVKLVLLLYGMVKAEFISFWFGLYGMVKANSLASGLVKARFISSWFG